MPLGPGVLALYDNPWTTLPFLRRNELHIKIALTIRSVPSKTIDTSKNHGNPWKTGWLEELVVGVGEVVGDRCGERDRASAPGSIPCGVFRSTQCLSVLLIYLLQRRLRMGLNLGLNTKRNLSTGTTSLLR